MLRTRAREVYLKQNRDRLKKAALDAGCLDSKTRESKIKKLGTAAFNALDDAAVRELYALAATPSSRQRGKEGAFESKAPDIDTVSLEDLANAPDPPPKTLNTKAAARIGRAFAAMAASSESINVHVKEALVLCVRQSGVPRAKLKRFGVGWRQWSRLKGKTIKNLQKNNRKGGRPRGSFKMKTTALTKVLEAHSSLTCRFNSKGAVVRTLGQSWFKKHRATPELFKAIPYSTLRRRCKRGRMNIQAGKKRTDLCSVCKTWDTEVEPMIRSVLDEIRMTLQKVLPGYFTEFDLAINASPLFENQEARLQQPLFSSGSSNSFATMRKTSLPHTVC